MRDQEPRRTARRRSDVDIRILALLQTSKRKIRSTRGRHLSRWAVVSKENCLHEGLYALDSTKWVHIIQQFAPLAKLIMHGRRQRTMLAPELVCIENILTNYGYKVRIDPMFDVLREVETSASFFYLNMVDQAVCDFCRLTVDRPAGYHVFPWTFRINELAAEFAIKALGGGVSGQLRFWRDWSPWLACDECHRNLRSVFETTSR